MLLQVRDLAVGYGGRTAGRTVAQGVSFNLAAGEVMCLVGPNGGGKTTLFRIASTLLVPTSGSVRVFGHDTASDAASVRRRLGVVFQ